MTAAATPDVLKRRLGKHAIGTSRELKALAEMASGEALEAVVIAVWRRRGWVAVATDGGLRLARCPRVFGRKRSRRFEWRDLTAIHSGPQRVTLQFGGDELDLLATGPHGEFVLLIEAARARLAGDGKPSVEELRELAKTKLGRFVAFGFEATIDGLPDRLEPGERVERLTGATGEFSGLLVLTDRRLLLLDVALRRANERVWAVGRDEIRGAEPAEDGLRLSLTDGEITLTEFIPPERRDEFAVVLSSPRVPPRS